MDLLTHEVKFKRAPMIEEPIKFQVFRHRIPHAVLCLIAVRLLAIVGFIFCPIYRADGLTVREIKEFAFLAQVVAARPKMFSGFEFEVLNEREKVVIAILDMKVFHLWSLASS